LSRVAVIPSDGGADAPDIRVGWGLQPPSGVHHLSRLIVTRAEFQELAEQRLAEAKALLDLGNWDGAYYLAGYSVELALKACIIKMLMGTDAFPDKEFSKNCYTHAIEKLVVLAKLDGPRKIATDVDPELLTNWSTVRDWSEEMRYHRIDESEARELYTAIADAAHGVLPWIKTQW
jgi:HEPN domain-containing protein